MNKHRWPSNWNWSIQFKTAKKLGPIVAKTNYRQFCQSLLSAYPWLEKFLLETKDVALKAQWLESEAVIKSMFTVLEAGHGCLSVHESLIVPKEAEGNSHGCYDRRLPGSGWRHPQAEGQMTFSILRKVVSKCFGPLYIHGGTPCPPGTPQRCLG